MKKLLLFALLGLASFNTVQSQTTIADARAQGAGANVSVRGVVLNGSELGIIRYLQDHTGGIAAYGSAVTSLNRGDSVTISGPLTEYYNLYEITPPSITLISANAHIPNPQVITPIQFDESKEGQLVQILNCQFSASGTFSSAPHDYTVTANSQTFAVRSCSAIGGTPIPTGTVNITGIGSQFCGPQSSTGCTHGYELLTRGLADFTYATTTVTGISSINYNTAAYVFPNPASESISFKLSGEDQPSLTVITDVLGKTVYSSAGTATTVDVSTLPKGFYTLFVSTERNRYKTKFIVE